MWLAVCLAVVGTAAAQCSVELSDSHTSFDLSSLQAGSPYMAPIAGSINSYNFSVCSTTVCNSHDSAALLWSPNSGACIRGYGGATPTAWSPLSSRTPTSGVKVTFGNGQTCLEEPSLTYRVEYRVTCDETALTPTDVTVSEDGICILTVSFNHKAGCGADSSKSSPIGAGWVIVIIALVGFVLYCMCGMAYKRMAVGASGLESLPNIGCWRAFGSSVKYGCQYVITCGNPPVVDDAMLYQGVDDGFDVEDEKL